MFNKSRFYVFLIFSFVITKIVTEQNNTEHNDTEKVTSILNNDTEKKENENVKNSDTEKKENENVTNSDTEKKDTEDVIIYESEIIKISDIPTKVYFKVTHDSLGGDNNPKIIVLDLFTKTCPITTNNFAKIITGQAKLNNNNCSYKDAVFHRIIYDFMIQGGDIINKNGTGSYSVYNKEFIDEALTINKHELGSLSMANHGPNTNGCQFFIVTGNCKHLDGKHTVFGKVADTESMNIVMKLSMVKVGRYSKPINDVKIVECGVYHSIQSDKHNEDKQKKELEHNIEKDIAHQKIEVDEHDSVSEEHDMASDENTNEEESHQESGEENDEESIEHASSEQVNDDALINSHNEDSIKEERAEL